MKLTTHREPLQQAIGTVSRAVTSRSTLPILSNILLEAAGGTLALSATDTQLTIRQRLAVDVEQDGRTTLPSGLLREVIGAQPSGPPLNLDADDQDHVTFRCGRSTVEVHGLPADEYPVIPDLSPDTSLTVPQGLLKAMINACIIAVSHDETRTRLTGLLLEVRDGRLRLVATDTHRLATRSNELPSDSAVAADATLSCIVPARTMRELERLLVDDDDPETVVRIGATEAQVEFTLDDVIVTSLLLEGEFPNYQKVIPKSHTWEVVVGVGALRESVRRCAIVAREDNRKLKMTVHLSGELQLTAESSRVGRAEERVEDAVVETQADAGDALQIAFNADYLLDVLNQITTDEVRLELTASNQPGALRPVSDEDYVYVLMPMQL